MEDSQNKNGQQIVVNIPNGGAIVKSKIVRPVSLIVIGIFFLLPFFNVSCSQQVVAKVTGVNMVFGADIQNLTGSITAMPSNIWAVISFVSIFISLFFALVKFKFNDFYCFISSIVGTISTFLILVSVQIEAAGSEAPLEVNFQFAFWIAFVLYLLTSLLSFLSFKNSDEDNPTLGSVIAQIKQSLLAQMILLLVGLLIIGLLVNNYYLKSPSYIAKSLASNLITCKENQSQEYIAKLSNFNDKFDSFKFEHRHLVAEKIDSIWYSTVNSYDACEKLVKEDIKSKSSIFKANKEQYKEFQSTYDAELKILTDDYQPEVARVLAEIDKKTNLIKETAPSVEKIKDDLIGRKMKVWNFSNKDEFITLKIKSISNSDGLIDVVCYAMFYAKGKAYNSIFTVQYAKQLDKYIFKNVWLIAFELDTSNLFVGEQLSIVGKWAYNSNTAVYNLDGTWSGQFNDGTTKQGYYEIINGVFYLYINDNLYLNLYLHIKGNDLELVNWGMVKARAKRIE